MRLVIDIGNTRIKVAFFFENILLEIHLFDELSADQLEVLISGAEAAFQMHGKVTASILSTVRKYPDELREFLKSTPNFIEINATLTLPIEIQYKTPETLGNDRIALAVGAKGIYPSHDVLVIDAGTCITYDLVTSQNVYYGGAISPGIRMRYQALNTFTAKLPLVNCFDKAELIGRSTRDSIQSGVMNGVLAEVDGIIDKYKERFTDLKIIITGGDAIYFDKNLKNNIFANSNVVLSGLNMILNYNVGK